MNEHNVINRMKNHVKENKSAYIVGSVCLVVGVAAGFALKSQTKIITDSYNLKWKSPTENNITTILIRRGHPGYMIKCNETGEVFASKRRVAEAMGLNKTSISKQLDGLIPDVKGYTFENLGEAA